jgi:biotin operon repressor
MPDVELTDRQQDFISTLPASTEEIARKMGVSESTVSDHRSNLKEKGVQIEKVDGKWKKTANQDDEEDIPEVTNPDTGGPDATELPDAFISGLRDNGLTYKQMKQRYGYSRDKAKKLLDDMSESGWCIEFDTVDKHGTRRYYIPDERDKRYQIGDGDGTYRFGLISDTHLGSKACHLGDLHNFYDRLQDSGVEIVLHGGDIGDGWEVHRNQINEVHAEATGWDRLLDYVVEHYPRREGMQTFFISGNHDHKLWKRTGVRFGEQLDNRREDLTWLGDSMARLIFDPENDIDLELIHPSGGQPYTLGYRAQTLYREQPSDIRPTISAIAHLHGRLQAAAAGVEAFYTACWKDLTTYGRRKGHAAEIGGWIVEITITDGELDEMTTTWVSYESEDSQKSNERLKDIHEMVAEDVSADADGSGSMYTD